MTRATPEPARLAQFRTEWPEKVTWADVRAEAPHVFRSAWFGVLLLLPAAGFTVLTSSLMMETPWVIRLPESIDWTRALATPICLVLAIGLWIWGIILLSLPGAMRRGLAIASFATARGMQYSRYGSPPERIGILFAENRKNNPAKPRRRENTATINKPLFRAEFVLWESEGTWDPDLQIAIAKYSGGKSDPKGPRNQFRYMKLSLPRRLPHLMIDARSNGGLRRLLPESQQLSLEGDFDRHFTTYAPDAYQRDALELLTPDVMMCLIDHGRMWDVEIIEDQLIVASRLSGRRTDREEYTAMLYFAEVFGAELDHQAQTYSDPRADQPKLQIAEGGRRLRLRSTVWATVGFVAIVMAILILPHVLNWYLDH